MNESQDQARRQADQLHKAIYEALRDGYNVTVTVNDPLPHCSCCSFFTDKRAGLALEVEARREP